MGVHRHGELGRDPPSRPRRRPEQARRLPRVRHPLGHAHRRSSTTPSRPATAARPRGPGPSSSPSWASSTRSSRTTGRPRGSSGTPPAHLRAAPRRARLHRRPDRRQGRRRRLEDPVGRGLRPAGPPARRGPGRLRRGRGHPRRPADQGGGVRHDPAVLRRDLLLRLPARVHRGVPGGARPGLRLLRRRPAPDQLRQPQDRRGQDHRRPRAEAHRRVPPAQEPPPLRGPLLPGAPAQREGARRDARRLRPPQLPRARPRACTAAWRGSTPGSRPPAATTWRGGCGASRRPRPSCWPRSGRRCCRCRPSRSWPPGSSRRCVDSLSLVRFDTNDYSVPTEFAHHRVTAVGHGRRGPDRRRRPRRGGPPPVLGPRAGHLRPGPLPGPAGAQARGAGLRGARWRAGSCRSASASCGGGWRPSSAGRGRGSSSRSCGCWSGRAWRS